MDSRALSRAMVWLIVRRWWGRRSPLSSDARESRSERGMSSSPSSALAIVTSVVGPVLPKRGRNLTPLDVSDRCSLVLISSSLELKLSFS